MKVGVLLLLGFYLIIIFIFLSFVFVHLKWMTLVSIKIVDFRKVIKQMDRLEYTDIAFIFCEPNWATDRYCGFLNLLDSVDIFRLF